jgi:hypothetical protein
VNAANFMQDWTQLVKSLAVLAFILTAFGLMLGFIQPAVALQRVAATLSIVGLPIIIPCALVKLWSDIPLWQWIGLAVVGICVCRWCLPWKQTRKRE